MPSRRQIREAVVQFLYCADLEGGADPASLKTTFWDFVTESDRRCLQVATFRTVNHLAQTRQSRLAEFLERQPQALTALAAWPEAESLKLELARIASLESAWSTALASLQRIPKDDEDAAVADRLKSALEHFFRTDRDLSCARSRFLQEIDDFPALRTPLEPIAATLRRLQRISDRLRMIEEPEHFPDQPDLQKLRQSKSEIEELRRQADTLADGVLLQKAEIDRALAEIVENFVPERIDPVDRAILRLATHEILHLDVPRKAAINEAIELAKRFGTSDSGRFVNGILDRVKRPETQHPPTDTLPPLL